MDGHFLETEMDDKCSYHGKNKTTIGKHRRNDFYMDHDQYRYVH